MGKFDEYDKKVSGELADLDLRQAVLVGVETITAEMGEASRCSFQFRHLLAEVEGYEEADVVKGLTLAALMFDEATNCGYSISFLWMPRGGTVTLSRG